MKKRNLLSTTLLAAVLAVGSIAPAAHAAETNIVKRNSGNCYRVYAGKGIDCLRQVCEQLDIILGNGGNYCPNGNKPDTNTPASPTPTPTAKPTATPTPPAAETPEAPETDTPSTETPNTGMGSYAEQVTALVNAERAKAGLPALKLRSDITAAANVRAREIKQSFSHTRPNGSSFSTALKEQGVSYRYSGENIAWGQKSPEQVMNAWMNSEGHRANILNSNFNHIGIGYYQDEKGVKHWVQLFTN